MEIPGLLFSIEDGTLMGLGDDQRARVVDILEGTVSLDNGECDIWDLDLDKVNTDCIGFAIFCCTGQHAKNELEQIRLLKTILIGKTLNPEEGDLVVYYNGGRMTHIGILQADGRILSKWGGNRILVHPIQLVPEQYGNRVLFYKRKVL